MTEKYDSTKDTLKHISTVRMFISEIINELVVRLERHDQSKLDPPEKEYFDKFTPLLSGVTYGSQEYLDMLKEMKPAIDHHHANNKHHAEFWKNGIDDMDLIDIIEMFCDFKAATLRHDDGDLEKSIEINGKRHDIRKQLRNILFNTKKNMGW